MSFEDFKARLLQKLGERGVRFREHGQHGWTSVDDILDRKPGGQPGPHWCDASFMPARQRLAGSYDFKTQTVKFYIEL